MNIRTLFTAFFAAATFCASPPLRGDDLNKLSDAEKKDGWKLLFDGKSSAGWRAIGKKEFPAKGWVMTPKRSASAPNLAMRSSGSGEFPSDFDILRPCLSRIIPVK